MKYTTFSEEETKNLGKKIAHDIKGGTILCLHGELGAGKTTFVQGIAEGYGITSHITSPTFAIMNIYEIKDKSSELRSPAKLVHIDTYRLKDENELVAIGAEDYIGEQDTLTVIEWPEKIFDLLKNKKVVNIMLNHLKAGGREIIIG
jgi:tRNA threonylcarbamoyladenosine biosynthesis protein TsaE